MPIKQGEPVVTYKETITEKSSQDCLAKSRNKHNRLYAFAEPLEDELADAIEADKVTAKQDHKVRGKLLVDQFDWDPNDSKKIWCFGPETSGPNLLVD